MRKSMPADLYETVTARYGEFPGKTFRTPDGKLALGMLRFGNIVLMPQSISGEGEDTDKVVHGVKMAPPHPYIATYLWIRHKFDADALIHFGTAVLSSPRGSRSRSPATTGRTCSSAKCRTTIFT